MIARTTLLALAALAFGAAPAAAESGLQPYQLVRSLQLIQDRLADGDHAALPMQRKALEMVDARMRTATAEEFADARNLRALFVYGISGGNPLTVEIALSRLTLEGTDANLGAGMLAYLRGDTKSALDALAPIDPRAVPADLGAFVALLKGSVNAPANPDTSLGFLDEARLLGPGTLVEEAALRRSIALAAQTGKPQRFLTASSQFVRRFLRSPYASQFADSFVDGVFALDMSLDLVAASQIAALMSPEQSRAIYLRIARRAAIEGNGRLAGFAADGLAGQAPSQAQTADARAMLYEGLAAIASDRAQEAHDRLADLDRKLLSPDDLQLLEAALSVSETVLASPAAVLRDRRRAADVQAAAEGEMAAPDTVPVLAPAPVLAPPSTPAPAVLDAPPPPVVSRARERLAEIDRLLERKSRP